MLAEISANTEEAVAKQEVAQTKEEDLAIMTEKITVQKSEAEAVKLLNPNYYLLITND